MLLRRIAATTACLTVTVGLHQAYGHDFRLVPDAFQVAARSAFTAPSGGDIESFLRPPSDSAAVAAVVESFHAAISRGDGNAVLSLLAPDAAIIESGAVESLAEYRSHHLPEDIAFAHAVRSQSTPPQVTISGHTAWSVSTSTTQGTFNGRAIDAAGAELMVLSKGTNGKWSIRAIHWSSRRRT